MLEVTSLGSGSSGNALLMRTGESVLLVDCGVGMRRMSRALGSHGLDLSEIDVLLVSHEHADHIRELPRFAASKTTILSTRGTANAARIPSRSWHEALPKGPTQVADLEIHAIPVNHDASEPCGYFIRTPDGSITVLTDLGSASVGAHEAIADSHLIVLEANHDEAMLRRGPYPIHLQRRILSDSGHLSNLACADLLASALRRTLSLPTIWLAHLSQTNNRPSLAKLTVSRRLVEAGLHLDVQTLPRQDVGPTWRPEIAKAGAAQLTLDLMEPAPR